MDVEERLVRFLLLAGDRATRLDMQAAEAFYRRALALSENDERARATALVRLASALVERGDAVEGIEAYEEAIPILRRFDERAAAVAMLDLGRALWHRGESGRQQEVGLEAISILESAPDPDLVVAYGRLANWEALAGRVREATVWVDKGLVLAEELGVEDTVRLLQARAGIRGYEGDPACLADLRAACELALRLGLGLETGVAYNNLADATGWFVGLPQAMKVYGEGIDFSRRRGLTHNVMWMRSEKLRSLYHLGAWDELLREADELVRWQEEHGGGQIEIFGRVQLADVFTHRGLMTDAVRHVDALLPRARESGDPQVLVPGLATAALVSSARGDERDAVDYVSELERLTRETPTLFRSLCLVWPVRVATAAGELQLAEAFLDGSQHASAWDGCARPGALATLAEGRGRTDEAKSLYADAVVRWGDYGSVVERAYALLGLGRCGDAKALREGEAIFASLGASPVVAQAA
jgi:tetratricopeptide (TPR) repeat protein